MDDGEHVGKVFGGIKRWSRNPTYNRRIDEFVARRRDSFSLFATSGSEIATPSSPDRALSLPGTPPNERKLKLETRANSSSTIRILP